MAVSPLSQRQKDDLLVLKARRSEEKNLQPLTKLAMRSVERNIDHFASRDRPFEDLPRRVLEDLLSSGQGYRPLVRLLQCPKYAHLMIAKHVDTVVLEFYGTVGLTWTECDVERVCALMEKSSATLRKLVIYLSRTYEPSEPKIQKEGAPQLSTARLHELLGHLPNLDTFKCDLAEFCTQEDCGVTNATLAVLAANCPKLRFLVVRGSKMYSNRSETLTKEGVTELCTACRELEVLDIPLPTCAGRDEWTEFAYRELEVLGIPLPSCAGRNECLQFVLPLLPRLCRLGCPSLESCELLSYIEHHGATHPQFCYGLKKLPQKPEEADIIADAFPRCQYLSMLSCSNPDLNQALKFKELRDLNMWTIEGENIGLQESFLNLLAQRSFKLLNLDVIKNFSLDLSLHAHHCPELEDLSVKKLVISKKAQYQIQPHHFRFLKTVSLSELTLPPAALPMVAKMFSRPNLELLTLDSTSVPDALFTSLVQEARENRQTFSSLRRISLRDCQVDPKTLIDVLLQAPRLQQLLLRKCDMERYKAVTAFVSAHLQHVTLECMGF